MQDTDPAFIVAKHSITTQIDIICSSSLPKQSQGTVLEKANTWLHATGGDSRSGMRIII